MKRVKLGEVLTESKIESLSPNTNKRITVRLNVKGVTKRPIRNDTKGATKYYRRTYNQFIYGKQNLFKGAFGIIPKDLDGFETSSDLPCFDITLNKCTPAWILYFFKNGNFYKTLIKIAKGASSKRISPTDFLNIEIPLPSLKEQERILNKIILIEETSINLDKKIISQQTLLKKLRQSILQEAIEGKLTASWRKESLDGKTNWMNTRIETCGKVTGGLTKNAKRQTYPIQLPYLRVANVYNNELKLDEIYTIGVKETELNRTLLEKNDLLIVEGNGSIQQIGRVAIWTDKIKNCLHQNHLIKFRSDITISFPKYILYYLMSPLGREYIMDEAKSTTGLYTLNLTKIKRIKINLPPLKEQKQIVKKIESLFKICDELETQINNSKANAERLMQSVLKEAFENK